MMKNRAGTSTRKMAQNRRRNTNLFLLGALLLLIILAVTIQNYQTIGLSGGAVLILLIFVRILPDLIDKPMRRRVKAEKRADRGAVAEEVVGDLLDALSEEFLVIHDIPSPYGNIDHVVIGKTSGVFLLETKAHGGKVEIAGSQLLVNGKPPEKDFIAQALKNAYWLRDEIEKVIGSKAWITPVVVFTNAFVQAGKPVKGVYVINKRYLLKMLQRQPRSTANLAAVWEARYQILKRL